MLWDTLIHDLVMNCSSIATGVEGGDDGSVKSVTHGAAVVSVHPGEWYSCIPMYLAEWSMLNWSSIPLVHD